MVLTATTSPQGFELLRYTSDNEVLWVPGDPGDTFTRGDMTVSTVGEGVLDPVAANEGGIIGRVAHTVECAANTVAFPKPADFLPSHDATSTLVPVEVAVQAGAPVFLATFANHYDETVVSYSAASRYIECTTGMTGDDYPNGGMVYVYDGPGAGEVSVCDDYDHAGGAVNLLLQLHRPFNATLTTASKFIVLAGEGAGSRGVGFFNRCEAAGADSLTVNQGANDGDWVVYCDWRDIAKYLDNLTLPVISARYLMLA